MRAVYRTQLIFLSGAPFSPIRERAEEFLINSVDPIKNAALDGAVCQRFQSHLLWICWIVFVEGTADLLI